MKDSTRTIWAGLNERKQGQPFLAGPVFAATYNAAGEPSASEYTYGRFHNPTWTSFENALADLEKTLREGLGKMPKYEGKLSDDELKAVSEYTIAKFVQ